MAEFWPAAGRMRRLATATAGLALTAAMIAGCGQLPADPFAGSEPTQAVPETARPSDGPKPAGRASSSKPSGPATSAKPTPKAEQPKKTEKPSPSKKAEQPKKAEEPKKTDEPKKPKKTEKPKPTVIFAPGNSGDGVRELQARLKQLNWFSGKVTDFYGNTTKAAVKGFQDKRGLSATGTVDEVTWKKVTQMSREPTHDELHNVQPAGPPILQVGDESKKVRELQARLAQIGWFSESVTGYYGDVTASSVKGFQDKRDIPANGAVDQKTWDKLVAMTKQPTDSELSGKSDDDKGNGGGNTSGLDQRCLTGRAICIDKTTNQLVWVIDGTPQLRFDVRFGADTTPTREGAFSVGWKAREWTSTLYDSEMPFSMFFSGGQAIHYSSDFAARGYNGASHGCVNVRDRAGIENLFNQAQVGDKVIVYRS